MARKARKKLTGKPLLTALAKIKVLILDIDGVMTDGRIFWADGTGWGAFYSVLDGFGIRSLMKAGVEVCMISGGGFTSHKKRAEILGVKHAYFGNEDKIASYEKIKSDLGVTDDDCAYMADELFDIPVLERVAFAATLPHAPEAVRALAHYIPKRPAGNGAVRELTDLILASRRKGK